MTKTLMSLQTMHLLASQDMGDAALEMVHLQDHCQEAQAMVDELESRATTRSQVYEQATTQDRPLNLASLQILSRQAHVSLQASQRAGQVLNDWLTQADQARDVLAQHRNRVEALKTAVSRQRRAQRLAQEHRAQAQLDDLTSARYWVKGAAA